MLNRYQLRSAELLTNYVFILIPIPGMKNPADGPLYCPDYVQDIFISTSSLILPNTMCLLSSNFTDALFTSIVRVHAINPLESTT